ncbi:hypothetical protein DL93DRAFT_1097082 [Clavulina sp. PMI_390]|nr:hypothetical protein DL93DRAFT_1097082 [Clavulina sp. PMI_390]
MTDEIAKLIEIERAEAKAASASLRTVHNSLQPFMNLPTEILYLIFELASSRSDDPLFVSKYQEPQFPGVPCESRSFASINLLCKEARTVALMSPKCWRDVLLVVKGKEIINRPQILRDRLSRSRKVPFNLFFYTSYENAWDDSEDEEETDEESNEGSSVSSHEMAGIANFDILTPHIHRCQNLVICSPEDDIPLSKWPTHITERFLSFHWSFPSLKHLTLDDKTWFPRCYRLNLQQFWRNYAQFNLTSVELMFMEPQSMLAVDDVIAPQGVKRLRLRNGFTQSTVINCLQHRPDLEHLDWDLDLSVEGRHPRDISCPAVPTKLPKLLSLRLRCDFPDPASFALVGPNCKELYLHEIEPTVGRRVIAQQLSLGALTFPQLKRFSIRRIGPNQQEEISAVSSSDLGRVAVVSFLHCHSELEELFLFAPRGCSELSWRWFFPHLADQHHEDQGNYPSDESSNIFIPPTPMVTKVSPLPKLRIIWFEIDSDQLATGEVRHLTVLIQNVLLARPDLTINLCLPSNPYGTTDLEEESQALRVICNDLEKLGVELTPEGEGVGVDGRLKLLPSSAMPMWPEAWGFGNFY